MLLKIPKELGLVKCFRECSIVDEDEENYIVDCKPFTQINIQLCYDTLLPSNVKNYMFPRYNDFKKYMRRYGKVYGDLLVIVPRRDDYTSIRIKKSDLEKLEKTFNSFVVLVEDTRTLGST